MKLTLEQLTLLLTEYKELSDACDAARAAGCLDIEGRLQQAIWSTVERVVSFFDTEGWIMWHILENEYGTKEYEAGYGSDMKKIKTPEDLLWLMNVRSED